MDRGRTYCYAHVLVTGASFHSSEYFLQFGWDKSDHKFALSNNSLHIYKATSTSIEEESGSPISIPEASSVIVLSLQ